MKRDYTHITVILDRTGSMEEIRDDTIGGFNSYLASQREQPGQATITLVQFDSQAPYEVIYSFCPISDAPPLTRNTYVPRASTPLLDAMGRGMNDIQEQLSRLPEAERPERVLVVIVTDGQENASHEFRKNQIEKMIRRHQDEDVWQFIFLSADLNAITDAHEYGVHPAQTIQFDKSAEGTRMMWESTNLRTSDYRSGRSQKLEFNEQDRKNQEELRKNKSDNNSGS